MIQLIKSERTLGFISTTVVFLAALCRNNYDVFCTSSQYITICMWFTKGDERRAQRNWKLSGQLQCRMAHAKKFSQIPMSKSMRDLCKEEDYTFLNSLGKQDESPESRCLESESQENQEEKIRRRLEREQLEQERQREIEEQQKEKEEQWKSHVAELAVQRKAIRAKLDRLREFRDFQKQVVLQDLGLDPGSANETVKHLLMRL